MPKSDIIMLWVWKVIAASPRSDSGARSSPSNLVGLKKEFMQWCTKTGAANDLLWSDIIDIADNAIFNDNKV